jgi:hypothetical protein
MANLLTALKNIANISNNELTGQYRSLNRINSVGETLEFYIKDMFSGTFTEEDAAKKNQKYSEIFSYLGNQNNPPDAIIREGDAIEIKKLNKVNTVTLALNSSYPKDYLYSDSPMITSECRNCEEWSKKDIIYVIGNVAENKIKSLWFVYGDCYAANRETYERIKNSIRNGISSIPDIEFGETNELGRVNKVDPLGITDMRIRGMWMIKHPKNVFNYIERISQKAEFEVNALMLLSKYNSFPKEDRREIEDMSSVNFLIKNVEIKSPNNPAKLLEARLISFSK